MGILKLGFLANFLSHPVISGFISASGLLIAASQLKTILGVRAEGQHFFEILSALVHQIPQTHLLTLSIGASTIIFLFWVRKGLKPILERSGLGLRLADSLATRLTPLDLTSLGS